MVSNWGEAARAWWQGATPATRAMATGLLLFMVVGMIVAASLAASPDYHAIYHGVSGKDASAIESVLREKSIAMHFDDKDGTVSVPAKDESTAIMYIEAAGTLSKDAVIDGLGDIDKITIGTTPEVERQRLLNQAQGELARKLTGLDPVQSAIVSLGLPSESSFVGAETPPSASVILTLKPGESLSGLQVKGIIGLIAGSVPKLDPKQVTLTDQSGVRLGGGNEAGGAGTDGTLMAENDKYSEEKRKIVQNLLDQTVGRGKAVVIVSAELSQDVVTRHSIQHTPAPGLRTGVPASTHEKTESYSGAGAGAPPVGGVAGAAGNLNVPSYQTGGGAGGGGKYSVSDNATVFAPDVTETQTQVAPGDLKKLSVAALVDTSVPPEAVATLKDSISAAVGAFPGDSTRQVTVRQIAFDMSAQKAQASQAQSLASQALWITIARTLAVCIVAIVLLFLLTRTGRRGGQPQLALAGGGANIGMLDPMQDAEMAAILESGGRGSERGMEHVLEERPLTVEDVLAEMPEPEGRPRRRTRVPSIEEQQDLKMESIRGMIAAHPESVSLLLKGWMADEIKVS